MELKMKKATRVIIAGACAGVLALGAALPAFASVQSGKTDVSYSTAQEIPTSGAWKVLIPSNLTFTPNNASSGVPLTITLASKTSTPLMKLDDIPGAANKGADGIMGTPGKVAVHVLSENGMKLQLAGSETDPVAYKIVMDSHTIDSTVTDAKGTSFKTAADLKDTNLVATLKQDGGSDGQGADKNTVTQTSLSGTASVVGTPTKDGNHTDVLTFGFDDAPTPAPAG